MTTILATIKLKKAEKAKLIDVNISVIEHKFIKIQKINFTVKTLNEFVVFTSKNSVISVLKNNVATQVKEKQVICVGQKTKKLLEQNGFKVVDYADYADDLGLLIKDKYVNKSFTFFSGNIRRNTLPNVFNENNIKWNEFVVYETTLNPKKIEEQVDGILFFSPSAIESYLIENEIKNEICFCIGTTTADVLKNKTKNIKIASPTIVESVIDEVIKYYK